LCISRPHRADTRAVGAQVRRGPSTPRDAYGKARPPLDRPPAAAAARRRRQRCRRRRARRGHLRRTGRRRRGAAGRARARHRGGVGARAGRGPRRSPPAPPPPPSRQPAPQGALHPKARASSESGPRVHRPARPLLAPGRRLAGRGVRAPRPWPLEPSSCQCPRTMTVADARSLIILLILPLILLMAAAARRGAQVRMLTALDRRLVEEGALAAPAATAPTATEALMAPTATDASAKGEAAARRPGPSAAGRAGRAQTSAEDRLRVRLCGLLPLPTVLPTVPPTVGCAVYCAPSPSLLLSLPCHPL